MPRNRLAAALALGLALAATPPATAEGDAPQARPYDRKADAGLILDAALAQAQAEGKLALVAFGANWCHDSRGFAGLLETERFRALTGEHFVVAFIDAGEPQKGKGRNLDLAERLGVTGIEGTPTVIVIGRDGATLNAETARSWRDAASRDPEDVYNELLGFAEKGR